MKLINFPDLRRLKRLSRHVFVFIIIIVPDDKKRKKIIRILSVY